MTCHLSRVDESNDKQESGPSKSIKHWTNQSPGILFVPVAYCVACVQTHRLSPNVASFGMCALAHSTSVVLHTRRPLNSRMQATHPPSPNNGAIRGVHVLGSFVGCCRELCSSGYSRVTYCSEPLVQPYVVANRTLTGTQLDKCRNVCLGAGHVTKLPPAQAVHGS